MTLERRQAEARLGGVVETAVDGIITIDEYGTIETVNAAAQRLFGYSSEEMIGQNVKTLMPEPYHSEHDGYLRNYLGTGERRIIGSGREVEGRRKDGAVFPIYLAVSEVLLGDRRIFTGILRDISAQKVAEERLRRMLAEKEILLRELHHRVKNNLQVIISLLALQARTVGPELIEAFAESQRRIAAIARVHEQLHLSETAASFDLSLYIERLCDDLVRMHGSAAPQFTYIAPDEPVTIAFDAATPLVLILNEVLTNAIKHAFPEKPGKVVITVKRSRGRVVLRVRDNGIGLPREHLDRMRNSMGLRLIDSLARQIEGRASFKTDGGTVFTLNLPQSALASTRPSDTVSA